MSKDVSASTELQPKGRSGIQSAAALGRNLRLLVAVVAIVVIAALLYVRRQIDRNLQVAVESDARIAAVTNAQYGLTDLRRAMAAYDEHPEPAAQAELMKAYGVWSADYARATHDFAGYCRRYPRACDGFDDLERRLSRLTQSLDAVIAESRGHAIDAAAVGALADAGNSLLSAYSSWVNKFPVEVELQERNTQWRLYRNSLAAVLIVLLLVVSLAEVAVRRLRRERLALEELVARNTQAAAAAEQTDHVLISMDLAGRIEWVNAAFTRLLEYRPDEVIGRSWQQFVDNPSHLDVAARDEQLRSLGLDPTGSEELSVHSRTGLIRWFNVHVSRRLDSSGARTGYLATAEDITEPRALRNALQSGHELLRTVVDTLPASVFWKDGDGVYLGCNKEFAGHMDLQDPSEIIGKTNADFPGPDEFRAAVSRTAKFILEAQLQGRDLPFSIAAGDKRRHFLMRKAPLQGAAGIARGHVGVITEITQRITMQEQLLRSQRLDSVGQLTAGVAHDFNNLLTVILGNADLLQGELQGHPPLRTLTEMIMGAAQRGAELTRSLLAFARKQALDPRPVAVNKLVADFNPIMQRTLGEHIEIWFSPLATWGMAMVDPTQLESALLNVCLNARDAMPNGGRLTIETRDEHLDEEYASQRADALAGDYVLLAVSDTGSGIPRESLGRVFDPFYTTKMPGKGSGLGLAMVYGFIKQSGGHISIYSEPGHGTTVKMYLPRAAGTPRPEDIAARQTDALAVALTGGGETILLVEDDEAVRAYALRLLRSSNYSVIEAKTGTEALEIVRARPDIDVLFTDVVMPGGTSGRQLADQALAIRPRLKVLYTSGYTENAIVHHGRLDPGVMLLQKPYRGGDLLMRLRRMLET